jgi:nucleoside phosphorylase
MFFTASARLSSQLPALAELATQLDALLRDVGVGDLLEPAALASELRVSLETLERVLAVAAQPPVDLLVVEDDVVCPTCGMLNPADAHEKAMAAGEEYRCSSCDSDLGGRPPKTATHYRLSPGSVREAVERLAASQARPRKNAIVLTALPVEFRAVLTYLDRLGEQKHRAGTIYRTGNFAGETTDWTIALAVIGAGNSGAATEAERAIATFAPEVALFVGVAGGIKDVRLGDVVAASEIYLYESGKAGKNFVPRPAVDKSSYELRQRATHEAEDATWRTRGGVTAADCRAIVAPIAAGEQVVSSTRSMTYKFIRRHYDRAVAVEMEGSGFLRAVYANQDVRGLVIRGISDLLDDKEVADAGGSQERAAAHAAAFAMQVLAKL